MKILILGASGMIGRMMFCTLSRRTNWRVYGAVRSNTLRSDFPDLVTSGIDLTNHDHLLSLFSRIRPDVVVNCAGLTKHLPQGNEPISAINVNALLPQRLAHLCEIANARLIHVSTDCVFSGGGGNYTEDDVADARDVYGRTKALGEMLQNNALVLRTSTIGHEYGTCFGLLEWFLSQRRCSGFRHAVFSGLTTVEFARVIRDHVIPNPSLIGLYNVGGYSIDKLTLLREISRIYKKDIVIDVDETFRIDRSLNTAKFASATGYVAPPWPELIEAMYEDQLSQRAANV